MVQFVKVPLFMTLFLIIGSKTLYGLDSDSFAQGNDTHEAEIIQLRYPIILVHGILFHDRQFPIDPWGRIPEMLRQEGIKVYFGHTDAWGDYRSNAEILKNTIDQVLEENQTDKVNIIAHSKGGIDSRYLIWRYGYGDKVASLTTVNTPHQGAEVADLVYSQRFMHSELSKRGLEFFGQIYGDRNPNMYNLLYQLTTGHMRSFNQVVTMDDAVYYQSYYSSITTALDDMFFFFTHWYIMTVRGNNDGLVSEVSAAWGPNARKVPGSLSHIDIIDMRKELKLGANVPKIYQDLVQNLAMMGF